MMRLVALMCVALACDFGLARQLDAAPGRIDQSASPSNPSVKALVRGVNDRSMVRDLDVRKFDLRVRLHGALAETTLEMKVFAKSPEPIEGRIHIDLPAGSIVTGYAVDVDGSLVDGALVDAPKAKAAYEQNLRRNIDPSLAEIDQTGGFNTRVSPIDDKKGRTIRLRFVSPVGANWQLPLNVNAVDGWSVDVAPLAGGTFSVSLGRGGTSGSINAHGKGVLDGALRIAVLGSEAAIASRHSSGEVYWQASGRLPATSVGRDMTVRILWDRSRSRRDQDHAAELRRLDEALRALAPARIEWVAFSSGAPERALMASPADIAAKAKTLHYAGATSFQTIGADAPVDTCLLVSDGRVTLDQAPVHALPCRLFAIASDRSADWSRLSSLAVASGGQLVETGARMVDWTAPAVDAVLDSAGHRLAFVPLPARPGEWRIALRAPANGPVRVMIGGTTVERSPARSPESFGGEASILAAVELAGLEGTVARKEFVELSRRYSIASPNLSFVVLERPEDYVRNDIAPPPNYARIAEWRDLREEADEDAADAKANRFAALLKDWNEQVAWWQKDYDIAARPRPQNSPKAGGIVPPPPALSVPIAPNAPNAGQPAAPPPPPPAAERDDEGSADVVVTGSLLPQVNLSSPSPVTVFSTQEMRTNSGTRTEDLINALPQSVASDDVKLAASAIHGNREYIRAWDADPATFDSTYPEWERKSGDVPAFYLDTADWLARHGRNLQAVEILLSALDLPTADLVTVGMIAARLERYGMLDVAVSLRERQAQLDPERPQPKRLLALVLARRASLGGPGAKADLERAVRLLVDVAVTPVDERWAGVDVISLVEANALLPRLRELGGVAEIDPRLVHNLDSDVRVVLDWSNDAADIDLWVDEPNGERAIFDHPRTLIGGHLSNDMTAGYGPEEYFLRRAADGRYVVRANVYSPDRLDPNGPSRVTAHLYRDWGRKMQREESIDLDLTKDVRGEVRIGTLQVSEK